MQHTPPIVWASPPQPDTAAKARARQARLDANIALRTAEVALQRAHRNGRNTARQLAAVSAADEAYQAACVAYEVHEPRRDPFAGIPNADGNEF